MYNSIARFAVRPANDDGVTGDAIIGALYKNSAINNHIKPGMVYDIIEIDGVLIIREVGKSVIGETLLDSVSCTKSCTNWSNEISYIIQTGEYLLTR